MDSLAGSQTLLSPFKSVTGKVMKKCFPFLGLRVIPQRTLGHYWLHFKVDREGPTC